MIIELITATFYGFALALAAFAVAIYTAFVPTAQVDIIQGSIFVVVAIIASYLFPKFFRAATGDQEKPQGLDIYIGESRRVRAV